LEHFCVTVHRLAVQLTVDELMLYGRACIRGRKSKKRDCRENFLKFLRKEAVATVPDTIVREAMIDHVLAYADEINQLANHSG
jgi:hypothetical protein